MLFYKYLILQALLFCIYSQGTYLHFDQEGLQSLGEIVLKTLSEQEIDLGIDYTYKFATGFIHISDLKISDISSNPKQLITKFDQKNNAIEVVVKLDQMIATANIKLKLLGMNLLKETSQIRIKKTRLQFSLVLGQKEDKSLKFSLLKGKFQTFKLGRIKILNGSKWYQKMTNQAMGSFINLFIRGFQLFAKKKAANTVNDFGEKIPNYFVLPAPFQSIRIDFPLLTQPKIKDNNLQLNFGCGGDNITKFVPKQKGFLSFGVSEQCLTSIVKQAWLIKDLIDISVIAQQLSDIMEIDSKTLAKIFPGFFDLNRAMDVNFQITLDSSLEPNIKLNNGKVQAQLQVSTNVYLLDIHRIQSLNNAIFIDFEKTFSQEGLYYTQFNMTAQVEANFRKEAKGFVGNLIKLDIPNTRIEDPEKFDLDEWSFIQSVFLKFGQSYANQVIYQMMINPENYIPAVNLNLVDLSIGDQELNLVLVNHE